MDGADLPAGPPTRNEHGENFPVASRLLPPALRPKVLAFYRFARTADDIADAPQLTPAQKLARLEAMEAQLDDPAGPLADVGTDEARLLLSAFRQDAVQSRYADWPALEDYCARSAAPVGRLLLRLHAEDAAAQPASDALCSALQILNHLQDLVPDREALDRIYLPVSWMALAGGEAAFFGAGRSHVAGKALSPIGGEGWVRGAAGSAALGADGAPYAVSPSPQPSPPMGEGEIIEERRAPAHRRPVLDAALDRVEASLETAAALPRLLRSRLRFQAAVTLHLAWRLLALLRAADPVAGRVALSRLDFAHATLRLALPPPSDAAVVRARVGRAGSSFARGMAVLKGERRRGLYAVYGFCRAVDDIADGAMPEAEKRRLLDEWQAKLDAPDCALSRELAWARAAYALPQAECVAMIDGMRTDATPGLRLADHAALDRYCRRVAGSVGAMAVRIFGAAEAGQFGLDLGRTLQLVNILRDVDEDAAIDRVYVPATLLAHHGIAAADAAGIVAHPAFGHCCADLATQAASGFAAAEAALPGYDARAMRPARVMMAAYRLLLDRMLARGFAPPRRRPRLTRLEKLRLALR